jgi:NhaB family Na+:H+ antiporter
LLGVIDERRLGHASQKALLVVFFAVVAVIHDQHLLRPILEVLLALPRSSEVLRPP